MEQLVDADKIEWVFTDCFARSCRHHTNGHCEIYTNTRPPTITVDGTCLGYDL